MYNVFQTHVKDIRILYNSGDLGEVYAIAMAKTLGCISLVTDDIKEYGPHYTLMRIEDSEVMPFAFYELLLLDYLESKSNKKEFKESFDLINNLSSLQWNCSSKLKAFLRRFWSNPYSKSEREWMRDFCVEHQINAKSRLMELSSFLED